jgi:hypothetical protein
MPQQMRAQLCALLNQAMVAKLSSVRQYLALGGQPNELVRIAMEGKQLNIPLLHSLTLETHNEVAPSVALLLAAGARPDVTCLNHNGLECTALMFAMDNCCCNTLQALLQEGQTSCRGTARLASIHCTMQPRWATMQPSE